MNEALHSRKDKYYGIVYGEHDKALYCYKYGGRFCVVNGGWDFDPKKPHITTISYKPKWRIVLDDMGYYEDYNKAGFAIEKAAKKSRPLKNIVFE